MKKYLTGFLIIISLYSVSSNAQVITKNIKDPLKVRIDVNDADGVFYHRREVLTFVDITNRTADPISVNVKWKIATDDWRPLKNVEIPEKVEGKSVLQAYCPLFKFPGPGFYRITADLTSKNGKKYHVSKVIGFDPEKIMTPLNRPHDMDEFWMSSIKELETVVPHYKLIPIKRAKNAKTNLYKVEMKSFGGVTVRGWLEVPKKKGVYPVLLRVPGYTGNMKPIDKYDDMIVFSFNPRNHGESDNICPRSYAMWAHGLSSKGTYFYRELYLDCIRAVDFLWSRKDVDHKRIAIWGGSQGGGLSFATAALDHRIDLCIADIPFLCDWKKYFEVTHWPEIDAWFAAHPKQTWKSMLHTLSYFDTENMADEITCPVIMGIGLQDNVCPPATSFATFNRIKSPKEYTIYKESGHNQPESHYVDRFLWLRKKFHMK